MRYPLRYDDKRVRADSNRDCPALQADALPFDHGTVKERVTRVELACAGLEGQPFTTNHPHEGALTGT